MNDLLKDLSPQDAFFFLIALAIGILMGLEREHSKREAAPGYEIFGGIRTIPRLTWPS